MEKQDEIKAIAYCLWEEEERPYGKDLEHYYRAEAIYQQQRTSAAGTAEIPPKVAGRQEAEAHEGQGHRAGHHRRRR